MRFAAMSAALLFIISFASVEAQRPFTVELRGGASLPTDDLGSTALDPGMAFGFTASARILPHASLYAGWGWNRLATEVALPGADSHIEDTGYAGGFVFQHPVLNMIDGWARVGAIYNHIELEAEDGGQLSDSGHDLGWEAGAGFAVPLGTRMALTPGVRYRTFSTSLDVGAGTMDVDLGYVVIDVGLSYSFGGGLTRTAVR